MTAALIIATILAAYAFLFALCAAAARGDRASAVERDDERKAA